MASFVQALPLTLGDYPREATLDMEGPDFFSPRSTLSRPQCSSPLYFSYGKLSHARLVRIVHLMFQYPSFITARDPIIQRRNKVSYWLKHSIDGPSPKFTLLLNLTTEAFPVLYFWSTSVPLPRRLINSHLIATDIQEPYVNEDGRRVQPRLVHGMNA